MKPLPESDRAILAELAADSDPEPATDEDAREARAAYERATGEAADFLTNRDPGDEHHFRFVHCSHGCELRRDEFGAWRLVRECTLRLPCTAPSEAAAMVRRVEWEGAE
jgi:hypothetical protein